MMYKKRGQATIFMILAVIIILVGSFYFYSERTPLEKFELVQPEVVPVKNFIEACINDVATQGIGILGINGGYITFPENIDTRSYLQLGPIDKVRNPYWWYDGKENIPTEFFIKKQIEDYVVSELNNCINDFEVFSNSFDVTEKGELQAEVILNENDVTINVNYPLDFINKLDSTTIRLENFKQTIPIRLKKIYETAKDIMEAENRDFFLEFKTIDLIVLDGDIPTTDIEATCEEKIWSVDEVQNKLKRLLNANLPYINVVGTEYNDEIYVPNPFGEDTYKESYYQNHYQWLVTDKDYEGLKVSFNYDERWPFQFYARPSKDGILKSTPQKGLDLLNFLCLHIIHFTYDVVYPVRVTITDTTNREPYTFSFTFKVSVDHNQPSRTNFAPTLFEGPDLGDEDAYCNDLVNEMTILTKSNSTNEEDVSEVDLTFTCGVYTCDIGKTGFISFGAAAGITTAFPFCAHGILRGNKQGFEESLMFIQTELPDTYFMYLKPVKEFDKYEVVKHDFDNPAAEIKLADDETAQITITSTNSNFKASGLYPTEEPFTLKLLNDDQEYDVTIFLSDENDLIGGYKGTWKPTFNQISGAESIKFHVLEHKGSQDSRFLFIAGLNSYSRQIPKPELI